MTPHELEALKRAVHADPRLRIIFDMPDDMEHLRGHFMLWRSVILQALREVQEGSTASWSWFTESPYAADFRRICEMAWLHPDCLLEIAVQVHAGELKIPTWRRIRNIWRQEPEKDREKRKNRHQKQEQAHA